MGELKIDGWMAAEADIEYGYAPYDRLDRVLVFRDQGRVDDQASVHHRGLAAKPGSALRRLGGDDER